MPGLRQGPHHLQPEQAHQVRAQEDEEDLRDLQRGGALLLHQRPQAQGPRHRQVHGRYHAARPESQAAQALQVLPKILRIISENGNVIVFSLRFRFRLYKI